MFFRKRHTRKISPGYAVSIVLVFFLLLLPAAYAIFTKNNSVKAGDTPIAYWSFDQGTDNTCGDGTSDACDSSNNGNNATRTNATWQTNEMCVSEKCAYFDGTNDIFSAADSASLSITGSFTITTWVKPLTLTAATDYPLVGKWDGNSASYLLTLYGDEVRLYVGGYSNYTTSTSANLVVNEWHHITATYTAASQTVTLFLDGHELSTSTTGTIPASISDGTYTLEIGHTMSGSGVNLQVASSTDDGWDTAGSSTFNNGTDINLGGKSAAGNAQTTGLRFNSVAIPQGATISTALLDFNEAWGGDYGTTTKDIIYGEDSDNCNTFSTSDLPRSRTTTTASHTWNSNGSQGSAGQWYQANATVPPPDITDIIQEIVNRASWVSGNNLCIIITDNGSSNDWWFGAKGYDAGASTAPKLDITYTHIGFGTMDDFHGFLDETKIFSSALSTSSIKSQAVNKGGAAIIGQPDMGFLNNGLLGHWKLNETSGDASDASGNNITLTNNGTTTFLAGKYGLGSEHVPASSQYLSTATTISGVQTLSFWVNPDSTTNYYASLTASASVTSSTGTLSASGFTSPTIYVNGVPSTTIAANTWQLVTVTTNTPIDANQFYLGRQSTNYFDGTLDDVRVYNRAFTATEVSQLYNWAPGPSGYWPMDENTGQYVYDRSGNGNTGTLGSNNTVQSTDPTWEKAKFGTGTKYDGEVSEKFINVPSNTGDNFTQESLTVMAWVKRTGNASFSNPLFIADKMNSSAGYEFKLGGTATTCNDAGNNGTFACFTVSDGTDTYYMYTTNAAITADSTWHHIAVVFDRNNESNNLFYLDGVAQATTINGTLANIGSLSSTRPLCFGIATTTSSCSNTQEFNGLLDEMKIYTYTRTPQQIVEDMNGGHPTGGSPIGTSTSYWKFDETNGTSANDAISSSNNTLTLSSASWTMSGKYNSAWNGTGAVWLSRADDADFDVAVADSYSISTWFKSDSASNPGATEYLVNKANGTTAGYAVYANTSGNICFAIDDDTTWTPDVSVCSTADVYDNTWHHVSAVRDVTADTLNLYIDGVAITNATDTTTASLENALSLYVGDRDGTDNGDEFNGDIDELRVFRSALTTDQVKIVYNANSSINISVGSNEEANTTTGAGNAPIGLWKFDEKTGTTSTYDTSGQGSTGTLNGTMVVSNWEAGKFGRALHFDGSDDSISIGDLALYEFAATDSFTLEAWVYHDDTGSAIERVIAKRSAGTDPQQGYHMAITTGDLLQCSVDDGTNTANVNQSTGTVTTAAWHHIATVVNRSAQTCTLYVDGIQVGSGSISAVTGTTANTSDFRIGRSSTTTGPFDGLIDHVAVYNYARTSDQVSYDYNRGKPAAWYKMDECTGTTIYNGAVNANGDAAGSNGTWSGAGGSNTSAGTCSSGTGTEAWNNGTTGKRNASLDFDGTDDAVSLGTPTLFGSLDNKFTLSAWIYPVSAGEGNFGAILTKSAAGAFEFHFTINNVQTTNGFQFRRARAVGEAYAISNANAITLNSWNHVVATFDASASNIVSLYINGKEVPSYAERANGSGAFTSVAANTMYIGNRGNTDRTFDGQIDDVQIFNYVLSPTQIRNLMNEGAVRFGPDTGSPL